MEVEDQSLQRGTKKVREFPIEKTSNGVHLTLEQDSKKIN